MKTPPSNALRLKIPRPRSRRSLLLRANRVAQVPLYVIALFYEDWRLIWHRGVRGMKIRLLNLGLGMPRL
jgi:hypothetical protein